MTTETGIRDDRMERGQKDRMGMQKELAKFLNREMEGNRLVRMLSWTWWPAGQGNVFTVCCQGDGKRVKQDNKSGEHFRLQDRKRKAETSQVDSDGEENKRSRRV